MLTKLMAFIRCQIALLLTPLELIAENTGNPHPEHTNIVKNTEACLKTDDGIITASQWIIWDQHSSTPKGTIWFDSEGAEVTVPYEVIADCDCIDAIDCCPEEEAKAAEVTSG